MRTTFDLSPLYRGTVGFDRLFNLLDSATAESVNSNYPPYNIERTGEHAYRISIAVAGFAENELDIETRENSLSVTGRKADKEDARTYLHQGIANRGFNRRFELADNVRIVGATLENGLLNIELVREIPEALKPRKIAINGHSKKASEKLIDSEQAA